MTPRRPHAKRRIVFVDPDDPEAPFWWPAMVVPECEIEVFRRAMTTDVQEPGQNEHLVCYFEDGSFSVVHERELVAFSPDEPPYTDYLRGPSSFIFKKDRAVQLATLYWETGIVPHSFTWVRDTERQVSQGEAIRRIRRDSDVKHLGTNKSAGGAASLHRKAHSVSAGVGKAGKGGGVAGKASHSKQQQQQQQPLSVHQHVKSAAANGQRSGAGEATTLANKQHPHPMVAAALAQLGLLPATMDSASFTDGASLSDWALYGPGSCTHCGDMTSARALALLCHGCHDLLGDPGLFQPALPLAHEALDGSAVISTKSALHLSSHCHTASGRFHPYARSVWTGRQEENGRHRRHSSMTSLAASGAVTAGNAGLRIWGPEEHKATTLAPSHDIHGRKQCRAAVAIAGCNDTTSR
ncbi:hypothetical protein THASP1DRAFT_25793 [Thamnocephalis sphaerospora]|uniref:Uncharacterized protein n=1 Tax=Thamnocephalis sphaerospora TaxID=78915 RepID=A0A4P9XJ44_9FUNG|nr:hypothetical protein THASP1DRAFT_25793 [Thamnocephalis sphaerospora]|eukprot:RKP05764.1 hypothetical protein THASP1DRAFT_25793 [Thamnocephalis sphaerospora]